MQQSGKQQISQKTGMVERKDDELKRQEEQQQYLSKLHSILLRKYPNQGFEKGVSEATDTIILTWGTIWDLAKEGRFEDIRPDIRVQNFASLIEIFRIECGLQPEVEFHRSGSGESISLSVRGRKRKRKPSEPNSPGSYHSGKNFAVQPRRRKLTDDQKSDRTLI